MLWAAQFTGPRLGGLLWALATWMKWLPVVFWPILPPRTRRWGAFWLVVSVALSLLTPPLTILQLQALFGFGARPIRLESWSTSGRPCRGSTGRTTLRHPRPARDVAGLADRRQGRPSEGRLQADRGFRALERTGARAGHRERGVVVTTPFVDAATTAVRRRPSGRPPSRVRPAAPSRRGRPADDVHQRAAKRRSARDPGRRGRDVREAHVSAGRRFRDDVGHQGPIHTRNVPAEMPVDQGPDSPIGRSVRARRRQGLPHRAHSYVR